MGGRDREAVEKAGAPRTGVTPRSAARVLVSAFFGMQHVPDVLSRRSDLAERYAELRTVLLEVPARRGHRGRTSRTWASCHRSAAR
jgi:hypothetical protein